MVAISAHRSDDGCYTFNMAVLCVDTAGQTKPAVKLVPLVNYLSISLSKLQQLFSLYNSSSPFKFLVLPNQSLLARMKSTVFSRASWHHHSFRLRSKPSDCIWLHRSVKVGHSWSTYSGFCTLLLHGHSSSVCEIFCWWSQQWKVRNWNRTVCCFLWSWCIRPGSLPALILLTHSWS